MAALSLCTTARSSAIVLAARTLRMNCFTASLISFVSFPELLDQFRTRAHCSGRWDPRLILYGENFQSRAMPMSMLYGRRIPLPSFRVVVVVVVVTEVLWRLVTGVVDALGTRGVHILPTLHHWHFPVASTLTRYRYQRQHCD